MRNDWEGPLMERIYLNNDWRFAEEFRQEMSDINYNFNDMESVRIPHTVKETPYHYFDENIYQMISGYRRVFEAKEEWKGKRIILTFDGVAHDATVYVNGLIVARHHCGYTAFSVDISDNLNYGAENVIVVRCDSRESLNIPPFGFVIDYMTYGGIYRDVYIDIKEETYISDIFITTKLADKYEEDGIRKVKASQTISQLEIWGTTDNLGVKQYIRKTGSNQDYKLVSALKIDEVASINEKSSGRDKETFEINSLTQDVELWDIENPARYDIKTELIRLSDPDSKDIDGQVIDINETRIGFRRAFFKTNGFYLNGRKVKLRGLNRHQSYAYVGYAMPKSMQEFDAKILKEELGLNAVRTSHYPQSHYFIDKCDELGLVVFTELPGWQHIGDNEWKDQAVDNVREMVTQYRNHPSIILWGVRINESVDDDEFYTRTNEVCRKLDPSRQTGGVRCYKKGSLLEDVYTYNDFSHTGDNKGCEKKIDISSNNDKPYLISEYNGHMYPTKSFDWEEHRMEHMRRHANVLDEVAKQSDIAGSFGWCMFDYNTHKDFGSGDRICYHGVMDMFRNPKLAAFVYSIQSEEKPVLELSSSMDIGEHPGCNRGEVYILTNADSVKMYKNDRFIKEYYQKDSPFENLLHGPIPINDYIGDAIEAGEPDMSSKQVEDLKMLLNEVAKVGLYGMSKLMMAKAGYVSVKYRMSMTDAVAMYNKYVGDWGGESTTYRFEAIKDDQIVKELVLAPMTSRYLDLKASHTLLHEGDTYDVAAIRILNKDNYGNILHFSNDPVTFSTIGPIEVIGPQIISLQGGMGGTYIKTTGKAGEARLIVTDGAGVTSSIEFRITK
ncbi:MAG: glycoside hydrolase family 2 protein [Eubacterium sp.]|nr:glycoside hydrolase family 2 protein [Eubacterium sp.]